MEYFDRINSEKRKEPTLDMGKHVYAIMHRYLPINSLCFLSIYKYIYICIYIYIYIYIYIVYKYICIIKTYHIDIDNTYNIYIDT